MMNYPLLILLAMLTMSSACEKELEEGIVTDKRLAAELRGSQETIIIDDQKLTLSAYIWRDFMPMAEKGGSPLRSVAKLKNQTSGSFPSDIEMLRHYLIKGDEIWIADFDEMRDEQGIIKEGYVKDGPKWGPDIDVDVVCEFIKDGKKYRILAKGQKINATH